MTDNVKLYSQEELNTIMNKLFLSYTEHYKADKMTFSEMMLLENFIIKLQTIISEGGEKWLE